MGLQNTGKISISDLCDEFIVLKNNVMLSKFYRGGIYGVNIHNINVPATGLIKIGNFKGASKLPTPPTYTPLGSTTIGSETLTFNLVNYFSDFSLTSVFYTIISNPKNNATISGTILTIIGAYRNSTYSIIVQMTNSVGQTVNNTLTITEKGQLVVPPDYVVFLSPSTTTSYANGASVSALNGFIQPTLSQQPTFQTNGCISGKSPMLSFRNPNVLNNTTKNNARGGQWMYLQTQPILKCATKGGWSFACLIRFVTRVDYSFPRVICFSGNAFVEITCNNGMLAGSCYPLNIPFVSYSGLIANTWYASVITLDNKSKTFTMYINGKQENIISGWTPTFPDETTTGFYVARSFNADPDANIDIGCMYFYDRCLSSSEISDITTYMQSL